MKKMDKKRFELAVSQLGQMNLMVVGDLILDEYLFGQVNRISPEAPVPVVWVRREETTLGGAGNVVKNLNALQNQIYVMGRCGLDEKGKTLKALLRAESVPESQVLLLESDSVPTILKTRILAGHQQVCRVDREEIHPLTKEEEDSVYHTFRLNLPNMHAVILSDYDKGYLSADLITRIVDCCVAHDKIVTVDPQVSHFFRYKNVSILTPNHHEAGKAVGRSLDDEDSIWEACREIQERISPKAIMITRGEKGMAVYLSRDSSIHYIPTVAREVFDVTGAGDTVISVYTAFHATGLDEVESALVANAAAGVVVGKLGAATASISEIRDRLVLTDSFF